ncbi:Glycosyl transferase [Parasponia andersonii]|uniref:Glycosyl transferase n=1 Tax=Parasponia andersonii TaxID=3476 RepID=A0A2P5CZ62_PARAD|nr:Glycosyl transferase [Parasponia andersonii]
MEEGNNIPELKSLRIGGSFKSTLSGRTTPRSSPSFRKSHSGRTPRREGRGSASGVQWFRSNRLLFWLLLITLWAYLGFFVQSRWAHDNDKDKDNFLVSGNKPKNWNSETEGNPRRDLNAAEVSTAVKNGTDANQVRDDKRIDVVLAKKDNGVSSHRKLNSKRKKTKKGGKVRGKQKTTAEVKSLEIEEEEPEIPRTNASYGMLIGPFGSLEDRILDWSPEKRSGTCDRKGDFARLVWSRRFVLIFHELSMTGAPLSMMELATELLSCGATVSAVALSKKGGLMPELARRRIKMLDDKADLSFKTAMKADLVIAGSAVCASWIDKYIDHFPAGASQVAWWIMENRREYFDRAKVVLNRVKMLVFISESQTKQWLNWSEEEKIKLRSQPALVPLSINDELAFVAGIASTLNTPSSGTEKMMGKRQLLRDSVRQEIGLKDNDMLVISLSSINPGKGQLLLLESANLLTEKEPSQDNSKIKNPVDKGRNLSLAKKRRLRALFRRSNATGTFGIDAHSRKKLDDKGMPDQSLKILIGSVGSKSNKVLYVKELLRFLSEHSNFSKSVLWTPATTRVAALYAAADVYVINSQGLGETFGRVTIEAMAFGLPVLGTDAGGTKEIVEHNVTGLLHSTGRPGAPLLAENLRFLLKNPLARKQMGMKGREKVEGMYLKRHMYKKFVDVLVKCMKTK